MHFCWQNETETAKDCQEQSGFFWQSYEWVEKSCIPGGMGFPPGKKSKGEFRMNGKNNQLNVPQAREAMDKFKMQAASDLDVPVTY